MPLRFIISFLCLPIAEIYSFILVRSTLRSLPHPWRIGLMTLYILVTLATWIGLLFFRKIDWTLLPSVVKNIYIAFTIGFLVGKLLILLIMVIDDARRILQWLTTKIVPSTTTPSITTSPTEGISRSLFLKRMALLLGGLSVTGFLYGMTNRYQYRIKRISLKFDHLPAAFKGMKVLQLSDIHSGSFQDHQAVQHGINMALQEKPDIIFFTGDLVNNKAEEITPYLNAFSQLTAPMGVYSVLGNHDYGDYVSWPSPASKNKNLEDLKAAHSKMGWKLMMNEHIILEKGEDKIAVIGIENWSAKANFPKHGDMKQAYTGLTEKNIPFKILLSHDPSHFDAQVITDYPDIDLTLSGHTHGMQFGIEIPNFKWSPSQFVYKKWAGLYETGKQFLYVNRGFGFLGYPGRLGILPEITVIELA